MNFNTPETVQNWLVTTCY